LVQGDSCLAPRGVGTGQRPTCDGSRKLAASEEGSLDSTYWTWANQRAVEDDSVGSSCLTVAMMGVRLPGVNELLIQLRPMSQRQPLQIETLTLSLMVALLTPRKCGTSTGGGNPTARCRTGTEGPRQVVGSRREAVRGSYSAQLCGQAAGLGRSRGSEGGNLATSTPHWAALLDRY